MKASSSPVDHLPNKQANLTSNISLKKIPGSQPVHESKSESKSESKKVTKLTKKRPFGSIRCRACNRYGLTDQCPCSPTARYSVMIQSKRISKEHQRQIRRLSFATVKEAETFRQFIAMRSFARPHGLCLNNFGYDASRVQNHSFPKYDSYEPFCLPPGPASCSLPGPAWDDNAYMLSSLNKKRPMDSQLDFQPPTQRKCLGLSRERFLPMESSSAKTHPMIFSWTEGPTSARPMPQQYPMRFKPFGSAPISAPMPMDPDVSTCAMDMAATRSTMGSPHSTIDSPLAVEPNAFGDNKRELNSLMMNVVSTCLAQRSLCSTA